MSPSLSSYLDSVRPKTTLSLDTRETQDQRLLLAVCEWGSKTCRNGLD